MSSARVTYVFVIGICHRYLSCQRRLASSHDTTLLDASLRWHDKVGDCAGMTRQGMRAGITNSRAMTKWRAFMTTSISYRDAGVDIDLASSCLNEIEKTCSRNTDVIKSKNDFAGLFSLREALKKYDDPILVSGTDGVGSKVLVAINCEHYDGLGQDLVAMCVNDIATKGAEPLFFLDYFATANLASTPFVKIVNGIVAACDAVDCALIGGETAEMPSLYAKKHFDLAGFAVGIAEKNKLLGSHRVQENDVLIGITSSGLHSNGFSLVRKIIFDRLGHKPDDLLWQTAHGSKTVTEELLAPTKLYVKPVHDLIKNNVAISAIAHITGGGISENVPRVIPEHLMAVIDISSVPRSPIFNYLMEQGPVSENEMTRTFNMGVGLVIVVAQDDSERALALLNQNLNQAFIIGEVIPSKKSLRCQVKI
jgi:phosphoribosylformylglycinamidine cyclo-ligase